MYICMCLCTASQNGQTETAAKRVVNGWAAFVHLVVKVNLTCRARCTKAGKLAACAVAPCVSLGFVCFVDVCLRFCACVCVCVCVSV